MSHGNSRSWTSCIRRTQHYCLCTCWQGSCIITCVRSAHSCKYFLFNWFINSFPFHEICWSKMFNLFWKLLVVTCITSPWNYNLILLELNHKVSSWYVFFAQSNGIYGKLRQSVHSPHVSFLKLLFKLEKKKNGVMVLASIHWTCWFVLVSCNLFLDWNSNLTSLL